MPTRTAGILLYRRRARGLELLLVHQGGPFWAQKDAGAWSIPKGIYEPDEEALAAAKREFHEETGGTVTGTPLPLGEFTQPSGKILTAWAVEGDFDVATLVSNTCMVEWPPSSGKQLEIPEVDRGEWFTPTEAEGKIHKGQRPMLAAWRKLLGA